MVHSEPFARPDGEVIQAETEGVVMTCEHASKLSLKSPYPGRFCIYCGKEVAKIEEHDGQLVLRSDTADKYVAVVYKNQQKVVEWIDVTSPKPLIRFKGEAEDIGFDVSSLITSFQKPEEVLSIE
jgi:hypothetical protein